MSYYLKSAHIQMNCGPFNVLSKAERRFQLVERNGTDRKVSKLMYKTILNVTFHLYKLLKSLLINNMPGIWCLLRKVGY